MHAIPAKCADCRAKVLPNGDVSILCPKRQMQSLQISWPRVAESLGLCLRDSLEQDRSCRSDYGRVIQAFSELVLDRIATALVTHQKSRPAKSCA
jgi:hypothetical protein